MVHVRVPKIVLRNSPITQGKERCVSDSTQTTPRTRRNLHYETGFKSLELSAWPGSALEAGKVTPAEIKAIQKDLASKDIEISALGYYPNYLDKNEAESERGAALLPAGPRSCEADGDRSGCDIRRPQPVEVGRESNLLAFKEVFSRFCDAAEKSDIKIAIENCPMMDVQTMEGTNIAFSPEVWDAMFEAVPSTRSGSRSIRRTWSGWASTT